MLCRSMPLISFLWHASNHPIWSKGKCWPQKTSGRPAVYPGFGHRTKRHHWAVGPAPRGMPPTPAATGWLGGREVIRPAICRFTREAQGPPTKPPALEGKGTYHQSIIVYIHNDNKLFKLHYKTMVNNIIISINDYDLDIVCTEIPLPLRESPMYNSPYKCWPEMKCL